MGLLDLNDDVLLHILAFLNPTDEFALSQTCTRFKELYQSGWRSLTLNLGQETETNERKLKLTEDEKEILEISGDRMQNIHISVDFSVIDEFDQSSLTLLETESKKWKLKKFCFDALTPDDPAILFCRRFQSVFRTAVCFLESNNTRNGSLETLSLSVQSCGPYSYLPRILLAKKIYISNCCKSLKNLALDCFFSHPRRYIVDRCTGLGDECVRMYYSRVIERLKNLRQLKINSAYLSNFLLYTLSQTNYASLQSMTLVLDRFHDEEITLWPQLVNSSPSLKVKVETFYDVSCEDVRRVLPACVPVVSWKIYSFPLVRPYSHMELNNTFDLLRLHEQTLQTVAVQNGSMDQSALLKMVTQCSKLQTLYLQGQIHSNAILRIASLQRQWLKLGVLEKDIICPGSWQESRQKNMARLCEEVSEKLGYQWKLESEATYRTIFSRPVIT